MMKRRRNQLVAIECTFDDDTVMRPVVLAGGEVAEINRLALIENMERIVEAKCRARIVYRWRSHQHLKRWMDRGEKW
jgi:hypothetical protein